MSRRASSRSAAAASASEDAPAAAAPMERSRRAPVPAARFNDPAFLSGAAASRHHSAAAAAASVSSTAGVAAASAKASGGPRLSGSARGKSMLAAATASKSKHPHASPATPHSPNINGTLALQSQLQLQHAASDSQLSSPSRSSAASPRRAGFGKLGDLLVAVAGKAARSVGLDARVFPSSFQEAVSGAAAPTIHAAPLTRPGAPPSPLRAPTDAAVAVAATTAIGSPPPRVAIGSPPPRIAIAPPLAQSSRLRNKQQQQHAPANQSSHSLLANLHGHAFGATTAVVEQAVIAPPPSLAQAAAAEHAAAAAAAALLQPQQPPQPIPTLPAQPAAVIPLHATRHSVVSNHVDLSSPPPLAPPPPPRSHPAGGGAASTRSVVQHVHASALSIPVLSKSTAHPKVVVAPPKVSLKDQLALSLSPEPAPVTAVAAADSTNSLAIPRHGRPARTLTQTGNDIDNPISLDDDEESQQHRLHSQSEAAVSSSSALYRPIDMDSRSQQRAQHRVDSQDWASVECLTAVEASGGGTWQWPDRSMFPPNVLPKLTFEPTLIKVEWTESEDAVAPSQRLSEGSHANHHSSSGGGSSMMRSGSNVVPPSPGAHSSHSQTTNASDAAASSCTPEYPHGATLQIPLQSIRGLDLHRYRPYTLLIYLHDALGVRRPIKIQGVEHNDEDLTGDGAVALASPPPDCAARQLRIEFDVGEALEDTILHLIVLTNATYKTLLRVFKDREQADNAAPPPFVRPQMRPDHPRPSASSSPSASSGAPYLVYPSSGKDQVSLHSSDLLCLKSGEFLNDSIVDFYLKYIFHTLLSDEVRDRVHFFNSFFYKKWCIVEEKVINAAAMATGNKKKGGAASPASSSSPAAPAMSAEYAAVSKWAKNVDVFSKDFLVVPVNESLHWSLAIICYPRKFFKKITAAAAIAATAAGNNHAAQKRKLQMPNGTSAPADVDAAHAALPSNKKPRASSSSDDHKSSVRFEEATTIIDEDVLVCERVEGASSSSSASAPPSASPAAPTAASAAVAVDPPSTFDALCVPAVLYLDSLLPVPDQLYRRLSQYLQEEWTARYPAPHPRSQEVWSPPPYIGGLAGKPPKGSVASSAASSLSPFGSRESRVHYSADDPLYEMDVPEQKNGCDCGLFLLEYTEQFFCGNKKTAGAGAGAGTGAGGPQALRSFIAKLVESEAAALLAPPSKALVTRNKLNASSARFESALKQAWKKPAVRRGYGASYGPEDWVRGKRDAIRNLIEKERREVTTKAEALQQKNSYMQQLIQQKQQAQAQPRPLINITLNSHSPSLAASANHSAVAFSAPATTAAPPAAATAPALVVPISPASPVAVPLRPPPPVCYSLSPPPPEAYSQAHSIDSHMAPAEDAPAELDAADERKSGSPADASEAPESAASPMSMEPDQAQSSSSLSLSPGLELD